MKIFTASVYCSEDSGMTLICYPPSPWLCANLYYHTSPVSFLTSFNMVQMFPLIQVVILLCSQFPR